MAETVLPNEAVFLYHGYLINCDQPALRVYSMQDSNDAFKNTALSGLSEIPDLLLDENCELFVYSEEKAHADTKNRLKQMAENLKAGHTPNLDDYREFAFIGLMNEGVRGTLKVFCENMTEALVLCRRPLASESDENAQKRIPGLPPEPPRETGLAPQI